MRFMKNILKVNIISILLMIISTDLIYSGCCCKKKPSNDGSKTNSKEKSNQGSHGPVEPPVEPPVVKPTQEAIKSAILDCIRPKGGNRAGLTEQWNLENEDGQYIIKFGLFKFTVASGEIDKLTSPLTTDQIEELEGKIEITRSDKSTSFKFSNDGKCKLGNLLKSLNLLDNKLRINKTEHLCVKVAVDGVEYTEYINLNNSLLYKIDGSDYIGRTSKGNGKNGNLSYNFTKGPYYKSDGVFYYWEAKRDEFSEIQKPTEENLKLFNNPVYTKEDINKFTLTVLTE